MVDSFRLLASSAVLSVGMNVEKMFTTFCRKNAASDSHNYAIAFNFSTGMGGEVRNCFKQGFRGGSGLSY